VRAGFTWVERMPDAEVGVERRAVNRYAICVDFATGDARG
jgi:hypothetical protein